MRFQARAEDYAAAHPFPHAVIDDFLPEDLASEAHAAFPAPDDAVWRTAGREYVNPGNGRKFEMASYAAMPAALQCVVDLINGPDTLGFIRNLTGFPDLVPDETLTGGGLALSMAGGFLRTHADFNYSNTLRAYRTVNLLLYLNREWQDDYGGHLEMWERGMPSCAKSLLPVFNRVVIFTTTSDALHGFRPVSTPPGLGRKSMNFYFYRTEAAAGIAKEPHKTLWQTP